MLTGYFFSAVIVSLFINLFLTIDFTRLDTQLIFLFTTFGGMEAFFLFLRIPVVRRSLNKTIDGITVRAFKRAARENYISVLDTYGDDAVVNIFLYKVPEFLEGKRIADTDMRKKYNVNILMYTRNGQNHYWWLTPCSPHVITIMSNFGYQVLADIKLHRVPLMLADKSLLESKIKDYFSINIMMVSRKDKPLNLTKDTVIEKGDRVIAFEPYESIHTVFGESPS